MTANAIGIDFGRTATVICLRDGAWPARHLRCIGDGQRGRIPNAADGSGRWASAAVVAAAPDLDAGYFTLSEKPWLEGKAPCVFWENLGRRLSSFLGRVKPVPKNGYRVVIAPQAIDFAATTQSIQSMCHQDAVSGLDEAIFVPTQRAVLCRWILEQPRGETRRLTVAVVCVGDTLTTVGAYDVELGDAVPPQIVRCGMPHFSLLAGSAWWERAVARLVADRSNNTELDARQTLGVGDAILELATRLRLSNPDRAVPWQGPLANSLFWQIKVDRRRLVTWPEVMELIVHLPSAVQNAVGALHSRSRPDVIVVGGVGACWPFAADTLSSASEFRETPVWQSSNPLEDVALGAALWPIVSLTSLIDWTDVDVPKPIASDPPPQLSDPPSSAAENDLSLDPDAAESVDIRSSTPALVHWMRNVPWKNQPPPSPSEKA